MDQEKLIDAVTKAIMQRLAAEEAAVAAPGCEVVTFGDVPAALLAEGCKPKVGRTPADVGGAAYIVLSAAAFRSFHSGAARPASALGAGTATPATNSASVAGGLASAVVDLTAQRVINESDLRGHGIGQGAQVKVGRRAILTALAEDYAKANSIKFVKE